MKKPNSSAAKSAITIGIDLGDRKHAVCVLDKTGNLQFPPETRYV